MKQYLIGTTGFHHQVRVGELDACAAYLFGTDSPATRICLTCLCAYRSGARLNKVTSPTCGMEGLDRTDNYQFQRVWAFYVASYKKKRRLFQSVSPGHVDGKIG